MVALRFCALLPIVLITESSALACSGEPDGSPTNGDPSGGAVRLIGDQMSPSLMSHATSKALVINMAIGTGITNMVIGKTCVACYHHTLPTTSENFAPLQRIEVRGGEGFVCWAKHMCTEIGWLGVLIS